MVCCCVPSCSSNSKINRGLGFHEFPVQDDIRLKWIKNISNQENTNKGFWIPNDRSVVCSLHFKEIDYKKGCKKRCLFPGSVPTVFPESPKYEQNESVKKRKSSTDKNKSLPRKRRKSNETNNKNENSSSTLSVDETRTSGALNVHSPGLSSTTIQSPLSSNFSNVPNVDRNPKLEMKKLRMKICRQRHTIVKLKEEIKVMKNQAKKDDPQITKLKKITEDAKNGNISATFIIEQIKAYGEKIAELDQSKM